MTKMLMTIAIITITIFNLGIATNPIPYDNINLNFEDISCQYTDDNNCSTTYNNYSKYSMYTQSPVKTATDCVVICDSQLNNDELFKCEVPFAILSTISADKIDNYTINDELLSQQIQRYVDFMQRSNNLNEKEHLAATIMATLNHISMHVIEMRNIIKSIEYYFNEVEKQNDCIKILDMWLGYRVLKIANIL